MIDVVCKQCGVTFRGRARSQFCSLKCSGEHRTTLPHRGLYTSRRRPGHPLATANGSVGAHRLALYDKIGPGPHPCHWCGTMLVWRVNGRGGDSLMPDHIDGDGMNNDPANLVPSCVACNSHRSRTHGAVGPDELRDPDGRRATARVCRQCGAPFVARTCRIRRGQALFCSLHCARMERWHPTV